MEGTIRSRRALARLAVLVIGVVAIAGAGTYASYNSGRPNASGSATPASSPPAATGPSEMPSAETPAAAPTIASGVASLDVSGSTHDRVSLPANCRGSFGYFDIAPTTVQLFGESVSVSLRSDETGEGRLVIERQGAGSYSGDYKPGSWGPEFFDLELDAGRAIPFGGAGGPQTLKASLFAKCGWGATAGMSPALDDPSVESRGTATFKAGALSATTPIDCWWGTQSKVTDYSFPAPVELGGERVWFVLESRASPFFGFKREGMAADYTSGATYAVVGGNAAKGSISFHGLTLDVNSYGYPALVPFPAPMTWFTTPLGGVEANRSLDGTLSWDCGEAPADTPLVEPSPEPPSYHEMPWPAVTVEVSGQPKPIEAETVWQCWTVIEMADPSQQVPFGCEAPSGRWRVPGTTMTAHAGTTLTWFVPGYRVASPKLAYATPAEVVRWRGGEPDTRVIRAPVSTTASTATFAMPPAGDWVVIFEVEGTNAAGDKLHGNYIVRLIVTA